MKSHNSSSNNSEKDNPEGWVETTLSVAGSWSSGGTPSRKSQDNFGGSIPWVKISDLNDSVVKATEETITEKGLSSSAAQLLPAGTICIGIYGSIGKLGVLGIGAATNQACANCVPDKDVVDPRYLFWYLRSQRHVLLDSGKGGTQANITNRMIRDWPLLLPPLVEQRRIARRLDDLFEHVTSSRNHLSKAFNIVKRFRQVVLAAACSGRLTMAWRRESAKEKASSLLERMQAERRERLCKESDGRKYREPEALSDESLPEIPDTWSWTNFDHCSWEITVGHVGPMKDRYVDKGVRFLRSQNVRPLHFDPDGLVFIPPTFHNQLAKSSLSGGEILVVRSGANTGDCCVFPNGLTPANCADLVITRPLSGLCPDYGALYVNSPLGRARLAFSETGIAQPHFNIGAMRIKAFPLPPLAEQKEIVRRVATLFDIADSIERHVATSSQRTGGLMQSILAKAFRGELVPTEAELAQRESRDYEPASVLLERIRAERASQVKSLPVSKRKLKKSTALVGA